MVDTTTREFMIAHLTLHGWAPLDITHVMIVNTGQHLSFTAHYAAKKWYAGSLTAWAVGDMPDPNGEWDSICDAAIEVMFKELTRDESIE